MMKMYEQIGEFIPDSLIASHEFPVLTEGIGLKAGQGVLKRGSLIMKGTDRAGYIAGWTADSGADRKVFGILTDDYDTGTEASEENIPATVYQTGIFNREAVLVSGKDVTVDTLENEMKGVGIYLRSVQSYE